VELLAVVAFVVDVDHATHDEGAQRTHRRFDHDRKRVPFGQRVGSGGQDRRRGPSVPLTTSPITREDTP